jgi:hypothetical protein
VLPEYLQKIYIQSTITAKQIHRPVYENNIIKISATKMLKCGGDSWQTSKPAAVT